MRFIIPLFLGLTLAATGCAAAQEAGARGPLPMLDTGGHMAKIKDLAFTPDGRQLVSASDDKTIRIWDVATGKTMRIIRGEVAPGNEGKIYAMALSPDGKWLAAGGWLHETADAAGFVIRLYDFSSGTLVALLKGHRSTVHALAFSPDGRRLISGSSDGSAIIWDVAARSPLFRLPGHQGDIYAVGFTPDGARAVTGAFDTMVRLWSADSGALLRTMTGHRDKVIALDIAPDGRIASGDLSGEIRLWDGKTGAFLKTLARQKAIVGSLSFAPDGRLLLATCGGGNFPCASEPQIVYDTASGRETVAYRGHDNIVSASAISRDGRWAATGGGDGYPIHIWDLRTGKRRRGADGSPLTLGGTGRPVWAVGFSASGRQIAWGATPDYNSPYQELSRGPLEYALTLPLGDTRPTGPVAISGCQWRRAAARSGGWTLSHRKGGGYGISAILDIARDGRPVASIARDSTNGYLHRSYTFAPDGETIISGGANGRLAAYDRAGNMLGEFTGHEGDIWGLAPSPDGRYFLSGSADQTLRLWNLKTRELLVTLFYGRDGEWVMWTPQGYYAASGPGAELIGWHINRGPQNAAEYVTAAQLRTKLNRPDIVAKAIRLASAEEAVRQSPGTDFKLAALMAKPVPRLRIAAPTAGTALTGGQTEVQVTLDPTPDPVKLIRIQVNGVQVAEHLPRSGPGFQPGTLTFPVPLAQGQDVIRVVAVNQEDLETPQEVIVTHNGTGALDKRGTLYILAIGVDKYAGLGMACTASDGKTPRACDLNVAGADAKAFAETMAARLGPLHERVVSTVLVNGGQRGEPSAANILDALGELGDAKPNDTIVMFVAGHGMNEGPNYVFLPTNSAFAGPRLRNSTVVPWANFQLALEAAKGRRFLFLDTCHSGNRYSEKLTNDTYAANIVVYAAARWDQEALERTDLGHGLFTYAIVEGVSGAAKDKAGEVRAEGLRDFLSGRVPELASAIKGRPQQNPQFYRGRDAQNYLLARGQ